MDNKGLQALLDLAKKNREPERLIEARKKAYIAQKEFKSASFSQTRYSGPPLSEWSLPLAAPIWNCNLKESYLCFLAEGIEFSHLIKSYLEEPFKNEWNAISKWAFRKGLLIRIPDSKSMEEQVIVKMNEDGERFSEPLLIEIGKNAEANILIHVPQTLISNLAIRIKAGSYSRVSLGIIASSYENCFTNIDLSAVLERESRFNLDCAWLQREWTNVSIKTETVEEGASIEERHLFYYKEKSYLEVISNTLLNAPHGQSNVDVKGVLDGSSRAIFDGMVTISKDAPFASAHLHDSVLLLSDKARADAIPGLEILNSNVKATHSASIGPIDDEEVFYLESRGLSSDEAKAMIVEGFLSVQAESMFKGRYDIKPIIHERLIQKIQLQ